MKSRPTFLLLTLACLPLHAAETLPLENFWKPTTAAPPGAKVTLRLPETVVLGHEIPAALVVRNEGTQGFEITVGGDYRGTGYPERMKVRVQDAAGNKLPERPQEAYGMNGGGISTSPTVKPGEQREIEFPLDCYVSFPQAGAYTITAGHDLGWKVDATHPHPVAQASLKVTLPTAAEAAAYVDAAFARQPTTQPIDASEALQREWKLAKTLSVLRHPVYLPALIQQAQAGSKAAVKGIGHIATLEATEALLALLDHANAEVVETSVQQIMRRLPLLDAPEKRAIPYYWRSPYQIEPLLPGSWAARFEAPLVESVVRMLTHESEAVVQVAGQLLQTRATPAHAPKLLAALQQSLNKYTPPQSGPKASTLGLPAPQDTLIGALDSLRKRGWRLEEGGGGTAHLVAWFRQLADPEVPKPKGEKWKTSMLTWVENGPKALKIAALQAIPQPMGNAAAQAVMHALEDADWGVVRVACEVAGRSKRREFAKPLTHIVETMHESFVQYAARDAAQACGARLVLWEALASTIPFPERLSDAVGVLVSGTIQLPPSDGSSGNSNFTREQRFAIRDAWRAFLQKHRDELAAGKKVDPPGDLTTAKLTGMNFRPGEPLIEIHFTDGTSWPPRRGK